jgi:hypothetical protein
MISQFITALCAHCCVFWEMCADMEAAGQSETITILKLCTVAYNRSQHGDRSAIGHDWEGERANRAFVLSLGAGECQCVETFWSFVY